jgi:hypothetical protein
MRPLRVAACFTLAIGAAGSLALLLRAGQHTPGFLLLVMAGWVLAPFSALALAVTLSNRWSRAVRVTLYSMAIVVTFGALAVYADDARGHRRPQAGFVFVMVPPASVLCLAAALAIAGLANRTSRASADPSTR